MEELRARTGGRGPDACIDAVGAESHGGGLLGRYDRFMQALRLTTDRVGALREAIIACRKGGTVSIAGAYAGYPDKLPLGALMNKGLTIRTGQVHVQRYWRDLLRRVEDGSLDPSELVTHERPLDHAPAAYRMFNDKREGAIKVILKPASG